MITSTGARIFAAGTEFNHERDDLGRRFRPR
jgi:hypothetical protein